jgi:SulP family sulfate permease
MVNFGDHLEHVRLEGWGSQYMDYGALKKIIKKIAAAKPATLTEAEQKELTRKTHTLGLIGGSPEPRTPSAEKREAPLMFVGGGKEDGGEEKSLQGDNGDGEGPIHVAGDAKLQAEAKQAYAALRDSFYALLNAELKRVCAFYNGETERTRRRQQQLVNKGGNEDSAAYNSGTEQLPPLSVNTGESKKMTFVTLSDEAAAADDDLDFVEKKLRDFACVNYVAFFKIMKKFDKKCSEGALVHFMSKVDSSVLYGPDVLSYIGIYSEKIDEYRREYEQLEMKGRLREIEGILRTAVKDVDVDTNLRDDETSVATGRSLLNRSMSETKTEAEGIAEHAEFRNFRKLIHCKMIDILNKNPGSEVGQGVDNNDKVELVGMAMEEATAQMRKVYPEGAACMDNMLLAIRKLFETERDGEVQPKQASAAHIFTELDHEPQILRNRSKFVDQNPLNLISRGLLPDKSDGDYTGGGDGNGDGGDDNGKGPHRLQETQQEMYKKMLITFLYYMFPIATWLPAYDWKKDLKHDVIAGVSIASYGIPQSLSYALLAGMPTYYGLYTLIVPAIIYGLLGKSRRLAVGPLSIPSLLVGTSVTRQFKEGSVVDEAEYIEYALVLTVLVGFFMLVASILRFGFVLRLISDPVLKGFTSGAAVIAISSMAKDLFGVKVEKSPDFGTIMENLWGERDAIKWAAVIVGVLTIVLLIGLKIKWKKLPGIAVVLSVGIFISWVASLEDYLDVVGDIPSEFQPPTIPDMGKAGDLVSDALVITLVGLLESLSMSKILALDEGDVSNFQTDHEMHALGLCNLVASIFSATPTFGGFSRSSLNKSAGAKSPLSLLISAVMAIIAIFALSGVFYFLPKAMLAGMVMVAMGKLVYVQEAVHMWRVHQRADLLVMIAAFGAVLALGVQWGVTIATLTSVMLVIYATAQARVIKLGRVPGTTDYVHDSLMRAVTVPHVSILRWTSPLFFANASILSDSVQGEVSKQLKRDPFYRGVVLSCSAIGRIDSVGLKALQDCVTFCHERGVPFIAAQVSRELNVQFAFVRDEDEGVQVETFVDIHSAVLFALAGAGVAKDRATEAALQRERSNAGDIPSDVYKSAMMRKSSRRASKDDDDDDEDDEMLDVVNIHAFRAFNRMRTTCNFQGEKISLPEIEAPVSRRVSPDDSVV